MSPPTLILNPWMAPHRTAEWQDAITLVVKGVVDVLEEYEETISSPSVTFNIPAVLRLKKTISAYKKGVKFSRINVATRDGFRCQYCGKHLPLKDLNYDHVVPRAQGGKTDWTNIVLACAGPRNCNSMKGARTPQQAGMKLLKEPVRPKTLPMTPPMLGVRVIPDEWRPYLMTSGGVYMHG